MNTPQNQTIALMQQRALSNYNSETDFETTLANKSYERIIDTTKTRGRLIFENSYKTEREEEYKVGVGEVDLVGCAGRPDVTLQHEGLVDDVDDAIGALDVRPEHVDPVAVPLNVVVYEGNKLV